MMASWYDVYSLLSERRPKKKKKNSIFIANGAATGRTHNTDMHVRFRGTEPISVSSGMIHFHTQD